jgi:hypothetical protein
MRHVEHLVMANRPVKLKSADIRGVKSQINRDENRGKIAGDKGRRLKY